MKQLSRRLTAYMFAASSISAGPALAVQLHLAVDDAEDAAQGHSERLAR